MESVTFPFNFFSKFFEGERYRIWPFSEKFEFFSRNFLQNFVVTFFFSAFKRFLSKITFCSDFMLFWFDLFQFLNSQKEILRFFHPPPEKNIYRISWVWFIWMISEEKIYKDKMNWAWILAQLIWNFASLEKDFHFNSSLISKNLYIEINEKILRKQIPNLNLESFECK